MNDQPSMGPDQQTYQRAVGAAFAGLAAQLFLAVVALLLSLWAQSPALSALAYYVFGGLPIWFILILVYHQHKVERQEALEVERLSRTDADAAALFQDEGADLQVARKRLDNLHKWGLGVVGAIVAAYLLLGGLSLTYSNYFFVTQKQVEGGTAKLTGEELSARALKADANPIVLIAFTAGIAFLAFVVARYVAGMTSVKHWQLLRGGASYLMGNALVAMLLVLGAVFVLMGNGVVLAYLSVAIPAVMALIGCENILSMLLGMYRPRRPGEVTRPAFDSRLLGWLSQPQSIGKIIGETINYQFGFEISRSWFYRLLGKAITPLFAFGLLVLVGLSSLVVVGPHEQAIVTRFGRIVPFDAEGGQVAMPSGLHLKMPWPVSRADKYAVGRVHQVTIGSIKTKRGLDTAILWTNVHTEGQEQYLITAPTPLAGKTDAPAHAAAAPAPGNDAAAPADAAAPDTARDDSNAPGMSLVAAEVIVQYRISDLDKYVKTAADPEQMLTTLADRRVAAYVAGHDIDTLLTRGRLVAGDELQSLIQADADDADLGLKIVFVGLTGVHPPQKNDVALAFHEQIGALQEKESTIENAREEATKMLAEVAGSRPRALQMDRAINELEALREQLKRLQASGAGEPELEKVRQAVADKDTQVTQMLTDARGKAAETILEALAYRWQRALGEKAEADRWEAVYLAFEQSPNYYPFKRYMDALADALVQPRKYLMPAHVQTGGAPVYRLDLKDAAGTFQNLMQEDER